MAKISELPRLAAPIGDEDVLVADPRDRGLTKAASIRDLASKAAAPAVALAQTAANDARALADRLVITSRQFYAGQTRRFAYAVIDGYGRPRAGLSGNGDLFAQRLTGPAGRGDWAMRILNNYGRVGFAVDRAGAITGGGSKNQYAFVVRNSYGRPAFAIDLDGRIWTKDGLFGGTAVADRPSIARHNAMVAIRAVAPDLIDRAAGVRFSVLLLGDSQWRESWGGANAPLCKALWRRYGYGGPGFVAVSMASGDGPDISGPVRGQVAVTRSSGWNEVSAAWSPSATALSASAAGATLTFAYNQPTAIETVRILHGGGDPITYAYNGAAETSVDIGAGPGVVDLPAPPTQAFSLVVKSKGVLNIAGPVFCAASGLVVHNAAIAGFSTSSYASVDQTAWRAAVARLGTIDAALIGLGGNDEAANVTVDQYEARMRTIITSLRAVAAGMSVGCIVRAQGPRNGVPERMAAYAERLRSQTAPQLDLALLEAGLCFGVTYADYVFDSPKRPLLKSDNVHVNRAGANILGAGAAELLFA
ncbi:SGNH/GDSL hydrolase family protein [Sphingomonas sp.]|uniref:SGNH/GDSL hydrolase family protein n=1 Tax=Sphingomonas sp. TaxID=28214 RepID=UPI00289744E3|nr:SGNH/GDSL hydrolase family protein [Sphingomonas sp.]